MSNRFWGMHGTLSWIEDLLKGRFPAEPDCCRDRAIVRREHIDSKASLRWNHHMFPAKGKSSTEGLAQARAYHPTHTMAREQSKCQPGEVSSSGGMRCGRRLGPRAGGRRQSQAWSCLSQGEVHRRSAKLSNPDVQHQSHPPKSPTQALICTLLHVKPHILIRFQGFQG